MVLGLSPEIGGKVLVGSSESLVSGLDEVLGGSGVTAGGGEAIINTGEAEELLGDGSTDNTGTTGSGHELASDGTALTGGLGGNGMDGTDLVTPETSADRDEVELGRDESALDGNLDFLGDLDAETDVAFHVTNDDNSLEAGALTGSGLLLNGDNLHDLVVELLAGGGEELVNNRGFLDGNGVGVDFFERGNVSVLDKSAELGHGGPLVLGGTTGSSSISAGTATASAAESTSSASAFTSFCLTFHRV